MEFSFGYLFLLLIFQFLGDSLIFHSGFIHYIFCIAITRYCFQCGVEPKTSKMCSENCESQSTVGAEAGM